MRFNFVLRVMSIKTIRSELDVQDIHVCFSNTLIEIEIPGVDRPFVRSPLLNITGPLP